MNECCTLPLEKIMANDHKQDGVCCLITEKTDPEMSHAETVILGNQTTSIEEIKEEVTKPETKPEPDDVPENNVPEKEEQEQAPKQELPPLEDDSKLSLKERLARDLGQNESNAAEEDKEE